MHDVGPTPVWNSSTSTRNPDRVVRRKFVVKHSSHQFNQTHIRTRNGLCALVQSDEINSQSQIFIGPQCMGHIVWLSSPFCYWSYNRLLPWNIRIQHPLTTKRLKVELNVTHVMRWRALYWQFCWDLVPSKLKTHRHYRLLRTRSWSHRQSQLICWQLRKNIRSIGYICGLEIIASRRERRAVFRAELPQNEYLTYVSLIQMQLPDSRIGRGHVTCCGCFGRIR